MLGCKDISEAVLSRWGTVSPAWKWVRKYRTAYGQLCGVMFQGVEGKRGTRVLYGNVGKWLDPNVSTKVWADILFNSCFCESIFDPKYHFLLMGDEERGLAARSGFIAHLIARHYCDFERQLQAHLGGKWKDMPGFADFVDNLAASEYEQEVADSERQADFFFAVALKTLRAHSCCWRRDALFLSLGDRLPVALPLAAILIAAFTCELPGKPWRWAEENHHRGWRVREARGRQERQLYSVVFISPDGVELFAETEARREAQTRAIGPPDDGRRLHALMSQVVAAAIDEAEAAIDEADDGHVTVDGRRYQLKDLLMGMTADLDVDVVKAWPLPITALRDWIEAGGVVEQLDYQSREQMRKFLDGLIYGMTASAQNTERHVKACREQTRGKKRQRESVTRQRQQQLSMIAEEKHQVRQQRFLQQTEAAAAAAAATADASGHSSDGEQLRASSPIKRQQRLRGTKADHLARGPKLQERQRQITGRKATAPTLGVAPEAGLLDDEDTAILARADGVEAQNVGFRRRTTMDAFMPKLSVVDGRLVPRQPAAVLGKVKLKSLGSYKLLVPVLHARGITDFVSKEDDKSNGLGIEQLKALFEQEHLETVEELTGRGNEKELVTYVLPLNTEAAMQTMGDVVDREVVEEDVGEEQLLIELGGDEELAAAASATAPGSATVRRSSRYHTPTVIVSV